MVLALPDLLRGLDDRLDDAARATRKNDVAFICRKRTDNPRIHRRPQFRNPLLLLFHVFWFQQRVRENETHFLALFGDRYRKYCSRVKRWIPDMV